MSKRREKSPATCEQCGSCIYVGDGDFACENRDYEIVIEDWVPLGVPCEEKSDV